VKGEIAAGIPIDYGLHLERNGWKYQSLLAWMHCRPRQEEERTGQLPPESRFQTHDEGASLTEET